MSCIIRILFGTCVFVLLPACNLYKQKAIKSIEPTERTTILLQNTNPQLFSHKKKIGELNWLDQSNKFSYHYLIRKSKYYFLRQKEGDILIYDSTFTKVISIDLRSHVEQNWNSYYNTVYKDSLEYLDMLKTYWLWKEDPKHKDYLNELYLWDCIFKGDTLFVFGSVGMVKKIPDSTKMILHNEVIFKLYSNQIQSYIRRYEMDSTEMLFRSFFEPESIFKNSKLTASLTCTKDACFQKYNFPIIGSEITLSEKTISISNRIGTEIPNTLYALYKLPKSYNVICKFALNDSQNTYSPFPYIFNGNNKIKLPCNVCLANDTMQIPIGLVENSNHGENNYWLYRAWKYNNVYYFLSIENLQFRLNSTKDFLHYNLELKDIPWLKYFFIGHVQNKLYFLHLLENGKTELLEWY